jgi:hypothetical protein
VGEVVQEFEVEGVLGVVGIVAEVAVAIAENVCWFVGFPTDDKN